MAKDLLHTKRCGIGESMSIEKYKRVLVKQLSSYHRGATAMMPKELKKVVDAYYKGVIAQIMWEVNENDYIRS